MTRCGQCRHWKKDDDLLPGTGRCSLNSSLAAVRLAPATTTRHYTHAVPDGRQAAVIGTALLTTQTFGCTEGELR